MKQLTVNQLEAPHHTNPSNSTGAASAEIARLAALLGEPTRSALLLALSDGRSVPAGELAFLAGVAPQTASEHLSKLRAAGLVRAERSGRRRYYRLSGPEAVNLLETLAAFVSPQPQQVGRGSQRPGSPRPIDREGPDFRVARSCYDHLAGALGVELTAAFERKGWLQAAGRDFTMTPEGERALGAWGIDLAAARARRRHFARRCIDLTERRPHLGGALGAAVLTQLLELGWLVRIPERRAVRLSVAGRLGLSQVFGVEVGLLARERAA